MDLPNKRGLCFDASEFMCIEVDTRQKNQNQSLEPIAGFISPTSLVSTLKSRQIPPDFDLLKIDIDSLECPLLDAVLAAGFRPRIVVTEASPAWPPPLMWRREVGMYSPPNQCPRAANPWLVAGAEFFYGCSLQEVYNVLAPAG